MQRNYLHQDDNRVACLNQAPIVFYPRAGSLPYTNANSEALFSENVSAWQQLEENKGNVKNGT